MEPIWRSILELKGASFEFGGGVLIEVWSSILELESGSFEFGAGVLIPFSELFLWCFVRNCFGALSGEL